MSPFAEGPRELYGKGAKRQNRKMKDSPSTALRKANGAHAFAPMAILSPERTSAAASSGELWVGSRPGADGTFRYAPLAMDEVSLYDLARYVINPASDGQDDLKYDLAARRYFIDRGQSANINKSDVLNVYREKRVVRGLPAPVRVFIGTMIIVNSVLLDLVTDR